MSIQKKYKVLIAPLNWGLGHATRMIPLIHAFLNEDCEVELASDGLAYELLKNEFPDLEIYSIPKYGIHYTKHRFLMLSLISQAPAMFCSMLKENRWLKSYAKVHKPDLIISDDRFGMYHKSVYSIYVTHQINVIMPRYMKGLQSLVRLLHKKIIAKYQLCLIPDIEHNGLSGLLAHSNKLFSFSAMYVGALSRFSNLEKQKLKEIPDILAVISGPEPQRTIIENKLIARFENEDKAMWIVSGRPESFEVKQIGSVKLYSHFSSSVLFSLMSVVPVLICRSGYSTLMDLYEIGRKAIIIPTPGQTEQIYLANLFSEKFQFRQIRQNEIDCDLNFKAEDCGVWKHPDYSAYSNRLNIVISNLLKMKKG